MVPGYVLRGSVPATILLPAVRAEVMRSGNGFVLLDPKTVQQRVDDGIFQDRILAALSGFFGGLALLLAAVGLYGVVAYTTARRKSEIGIRMALGAERGSVVWLVLRDALAMVACGLVLGLALAIAAAGAVRSMLFGVPSGDPLSFVSTGILLVIIGLAASLIPAWRAARVDPSLVLRLV